MHRRPLRVAVVLLLFAAAGGAATFAWNVDREFAALSPAAHAAAARFDRLVQSIARFDAAQQLFDPAREPQPEWFGRVRTLLAQIQADATALHGSTVSASAARTFDDVTARVASAIARAEENLRDGYDLMAADLVQDEARPGVEAMRAAALEWRAAEANAADAAGAALRQQLWTVLGGTLAIWTIGVLLLARRPRVAPLAVASDPSMAAEPAGNAAIAAPADAAEIRPVGSIEHTPAPLDLVPAAELCADIARAENSDALAALLDRAAAVIGASGIVVWLAGGETELVPALVHGYGPQTLGLPGTLPLADENMTTRAWHTGELQWIDGDRQSRSAIAAPMFQGLRRTGVLAVELMEGANADALPRALTSILAAQFASAVSPQPEPSAADRPVEARPA